MIRLVSVEWMKVRGYRTFWVLLALFGAAVPVLCATFASITERIMRTVPQFGDAMSFPRVFENVAWLNGFLTPILGILLIILLTNEREFRTLRQNVIDGWSRDQVIVAKFCVMLCLVLLITLAVAVASLMYGWKHGGALSGEAFKFLAWSTLQSLTYLSFAFFLGTFLKRSGIAIALYVFYAYLGGLMLATFLDTRVSMHSGAYLPLEAADRLLQGEFKAIRGFMAQQAGQAGQTVHPEPTASVYISIAAAHVLLFNFLSWHRMRRTDL